MLAAQTENCDVAIHALLTHGADPNIVDYNVSCQVRSRQVRLEIEKPILKSRFAILTSL